MKIVYFVHGTTTDNEKGVATGWAQGQLSELGKKQSIELWDQVKDRDIETVFCSDLKRAADSAKLTFEGKIPVIEDRRLRECDYGKLTRADSGKVGALAKNCIDKPFPGGESYRDVEKRVRDFLEDVSKNYSGKTIGIVSHRAPQLALEVITKGRTWKQAMEEDWRVQESKEWKPGWDYEFEE